MIALCLMLSGLGSGLMAQDGTTNGGQVEVTPEFLLEATAEAVVEVTSEPTVEATTEATTEVTSEPTVEATTEVTTEVTSVPTIEPTSSPADLFQEDFQDGEISGWTADAGWQISAEDSNLFLSAAAPDQTATVNNITWAHVLFSARLRVDSGSTAQVLIRSGVEHYTIVLDAYGTASLYRGETSLAPVPAPAQPDIDPVVDWRTLNIQALGSQITVAVNGVVQFSFNDPQPLGDGLVTFKTGASNTGSVAIDDVLLYRLEAPIATEITATPEATEATDEPALEVTADPYPPEPALSLVFRSDFNSGPDANWVLGPNWAFVESEGGQALQINGVDESVITASTPALNAVVQARFLINSGTALLGIQQSVIGDYQVEMTASGEVGLRRGGDLFASAIVEPSAPGQWRTIRLSVIDQVLRVAVDGVEVIITRDFAPLPPGDIFFGGILGASLLVDDVEVWAPGDAAPVEVEVTVEATAEPTAYPTKEDPDTARSKDEGRPTDEWAVTLQSGTDPQATAASLGFEYIGPVANLPNTYLFRKADTNSSRTRAIEASSQLEDADSVIWFEQQIATQMSTRGVIEPIAQDEPQATDLPDNLLQGGISSGIIDPSEDAAVRNGSGFLGQSFVFEVNGDVVASGVGTRGRGEGQFSITGIPADGTVYQAFLYWANIGYNNTYNTLRLNGYQTTGSLIGTGASTCWQFSQAQLESNYVYRADVTNLVAGNGSYIVTGLPNFAIAPGTSNSQGATLVVVYSSPSQPRRRIIINDGALSNSDGINLFNINNSLSGFVAASPSNAKLTLIVADGQAPFADGPLTFNNRTIASNPFRGNRGPSWDTTTYNVSRYSPIITPVSVSISPINDCLLWAANILSVTVNWHQSDPLFSQQWHLVNSGQLGGTRGADANVARAWSKGYTGTDVVIAVVDDGLQRTHPDLVTNYSATGSYDFNSNDSDPSPSSGSPHGTAASGVAAASSGGSCGVGAAYNATLSGIRLLGGATTDATDASALTYQFGFNHIYSNSWGPTDDGKTLNTGTFLSLSSLENGVQNGRSNRGSIYVWAGGNGRAAFDNMNADSLANSRFTIAVGAIDDRGRFSDYSEQGAALFIAAPSNGNSRPGIHTTDLVGSSGYDPGDCTSTFGGTSSATPLVSGVIALMLDANPNLGWRDVQHILALTAVKTDPSNSDWTRNRAGYNINHNYGFGRVNAASAVQLAETWANVPVAQSYQSPVIVENRTIPDNNATGISSTHSFNIADPNFVLEHVEVVFSAEHTYRGDLEITLRAPSGTTSRLMTVRPSDSNDNYSSWKFMTVRNWGETANGNWTLNVRDRASLDQGTLQSWQIILHGYSKPAAVTSAPVPVSPVNNSTQTDTMISFSWSAVPNATDYLLEIDTDNRFNNAPLVLPINGNSHSRPVLQNGIYYWRVRARSLNQNSAYSRVFRFTVDTVGPISPLLALPAQASTVTTARPRLTWRASSGAAFYHVQIDNNSNFSSPEVDAFPRGTALPVGITLPQGTYYWRMAAVDAAGNEGVFGLSRYFSINIQTTPRDFTYFATPAPSRSVSFSWASVPAATAYEIEIATNDTFSNVVFSTLQAGRSINVVLARGSYFWRVNYFIGANKYTSPFSYVVTVSPPVPGRPVLSSPLNNTATPDTTPTFTWLPVPYSYGTVYYEIQISRTSNFNSIVEWVYVDNPTYTPSTVLSSGNYYWRVLTRNDLDVPGVWSLVRRVLVQ